MNSMIKNFAAKITLITLIGLSVLATI